MRYVIVNYGNQNNKLDSKFHPWIWVAFIFATIFNSVYTIYTGYFGVELNAAELVLNLIIDILVYGVVPVVVFYAIAVSFYNSLARRRLFDISKKDFIYVTMIVIAIARTVMGVIRIFAFLEPDIDLYTALILDFALSTIALYVEFFVILQPKYNLNHYQSYQYFKVLSKNYTICLGVISVVLGAIFILAGDILESALALGDEYVITYQGEPLTEAEVEVFRYLFRGPLKIVGYMILAFFGVTLATHIGLSVWMKKRAQKYRDDHPSEFVQSGPNPFAGNPYGPYGNPYNNSPYGPYGNPYQNQQQNPFDNGGANPFEEKESNPFGDDFNSSKDDNPFGDID